MSPTAAGCNYRWDIATASTSAFNQSDFLALSPLLESVSKDTYQADITYTDATCTAMDPSGKYCVSAGCKPGQVREYYTMRAICHGLGLLFKDSPARCECSDPTTTWNSATGVCVAFRDRYWDKPKACPAAGNPIYPLTGVKREEQRLGISVAGIDLLVAFDNRSGITEANGQPTWLLSTPPSFGPLWNSNLHRSLVAQTSNGTLATKDSSIAVHRGGGVWETFVTAGGPRYDSSAGQSNELNFFNNAWTLIDRSALLEEAYDANGRLTSIAMAQGGKVNLAYSTASTPPELAPVPGLLLQISDAFGRTTKFSYESPHASGLRPRIRQVRSPDGAAMSVLYDAMGNLQAMTWPDGSTRTFLYQRPDLPFALTGIGDELGQQISTYGYDGQGRAR